MAMFIASYKITDMWKAEMKKYLIEMLSAVGIFFIAFLVAGALSESIGEYMHEGFAYEEALSKFIEKSFLGSIVLVCGYYIMKGYGVSIWKALGVWLIFFFILAMTTRQYHYNLHPSINTFQKYFDACIWEALFLTFIFYLFRGVIRKFIKPKKIEPNTTKPIQIPQKGTLAIIKRFLSSRF